MDDLPSDILINIFTKYLEDDDDYREPRTHTPAFSPWCSSDPVILGQVCRYWRTIALFNTVMWSKIYIKDPQPSQIERTKLWLDRAGSHPLDLGIIYLDTEDMDEAATTDILRLFIYSLPYWRKIDFQLPYWNIQDLAVIATSDRRCNDLEVACIDPMEPTWDELLNPTDQAYLEAIWKTFHSSPRLHEVCWHSVFDTVRLPEHVPWSQMRRIRSVELSLPDFLQVLMSCPKLELFVVVAIAFEYQTSQAQTPTAITHDSLTHLAISGDSSRKKALIDAICLPSLRTLEIFDSQDPNNRVKLFPTLHKFLCKSGCHLRRLHYAEYSADAGHDSVEVLGCSAFQTLRFLRLDLKSISDDVLLVLSHKKPDGFHQLIPRLEEIELWECNCNVNLLFNMIISRFNAFLKLAKLVRRLGDISPLELTQIEDFFPEQSQGGTYTHWILRGQGIGKP